MKSIYSLLLLLVLILVLLYIKNNIETFLIWSKLSKKQRCKKKCHKYKKKAKEYKNCMSRC